jgi:hypothetical protein
MQGRTRLRFAFLILGLQAFVLLMLVGSAQSQGLRTSPYSAPSMLRGLSEQGPRQAPSDIVSLSSGLFPGILPPIPNLQIGYLYSFGSNVRSGRFTADYLLPISLGMDSVVFGEAHSEFQSFWNTTSFNNRTDVSLGGGYRIILRDMTLLGVNGFYDTSRLGGQWYSSEGVGVEMAALLPGNDTVDINFNWYGQLFDSDVIRNAFRYGPSNFDAEAGYSHELWGGGPDLRLKITGYQFHTGSKIGGWNAGAELKSRDGVLVLRYNVGNDRINQTYHTVGGFVNVGFRMDNILLGESPIEMPEPIFKSPRNLRRFLVRNVARNYQQATAISASRGGACHLPGYAVLGYDALAMNVTYPANPALPDPLPNTSTIRLHWCGVLSSVDFCGVYAYSGTTAAAGGD